MEQKLTITKSFAELQDQSIDEVKYYFKSAISMIDEEFGPGYAKEHPELITGIIKAISVENHGVSITAGILQLEEELSSSIDALSEIVEKRDLN